MGSALVRALGATLAFVVMCMSAMDTPAQAQGATAAYPERTITIVVGFAAGGGNDIMARLVSQKLSERFGQPVIVENKVGAGGRLAVEHVARQPGDGYTILVATSTDMTVTPLISKTAYSPLTSFAPLTTIAGFSYFLTVPHNHPAQNVRELVDWTKAHPDKANYATTGPGFTLPTELFKQVTGATGQPVNYRGAGEAMTAVLSGQVSMGMLGGSQIVPLVNEGKLRALAFTSGTRSMELPDVPTFKEIGLDVEYAGWVGLFVLSNTPPEIATKLSEALRSIVRSKDASDSLTKMAYTPVGDTPADITRKIDKDLKRWAAVIAAGNLKLGD